MGRAGCPPLDYLAAVRRASFKHPSGPVDASVMTRLRARGAVLAVLALAPVVVAAPAPAARAATWSAPIANAVRPAGAEELTALRAELAAATAEVERLAEEVFREAARSANLRRAMDNLAEQQDAARDALDRRIRSLYMRGRADALTTYVAGLRNPDIAYLGRSGAIRELASDQALIAGVREESVAAAALRARAEALRRELLSRAQPVLAAQERARRLLARAEAQAVADAAARAELAQRRAALDTLSRTLTVAVAPAVTKRGRRAAAAEAPVIAHVEQHCCGVPPGYRATGQVITGIASWYGPGFVGNPTATGAPYDPERLTAAMLAVPLGTVVRVTTEDGRAVVVLVNDRGPYAEGRVIDLSRAGSRALGFDGLKRVTVEVLEPA